MVIAGQAGRMARRRCRRAGRQAVPSPRARRREPGRRTSQRAPRGCKSDQHRFARAFSLPRSRSTAGGLGNPGDRLDADRRVAFSRCPSATVWASAALQYGQRPRTLKVGRRSRRPLSYGAWPADTLAGCRTSPHIRQKIAWVGARVCPAVSAAAAPCGLPPAAWVSP